ncbi:MAG: hypothetical protein GX654_00300 [Desulfatiglans sp.]|jgi:hypothetical protein|nr:hypothetical protein [Desulfatiglans sp.]
MMKYFTLDRWIADQDLDADSSENLRAYEDYEKYLSGIQARLPNGLQWLLSEFCLVDASLREVSIDIPSSKASLRFDAGDVTMQGGRDITLHYRGVVAVRSTGDPEKGLPGPCGFGDLGNDELELLNDGLIEHRFIFSSGIQLMLRFDTAELEENQER